MPANSTDAKNADEIQVAFSHDELQSDDGISPRLLSRVKWKLDLFILPIISIVYFFAQMVRMSWFYTLLYTDPVANCREDQISPTPKLQVSQMN